MQRLSFAAFTVSFVIMLSACVTTGLQKPETQGTINGQMTVTSFVLEADGAAMHNYTAISKREAAGVTVWVITQKTSSDGVPLTRPQNAPRVIEINVNGKGYTIDVPIGQWDINVQSGVTFYRMWAGIPDDLLNALLDAQTIIVPLAKLNNDYGEISQELVTGLREFIRRQ